MQDSTTKNTGSTSQRLYKCPVCQSKLTLYQSDTLPDHYLYKCDTCGHSELFQKDRRQNERNS